MRNRYLVKYNIGGMEFKEVKRLSNKEVKELKADKNYKVEKIKH